MKRKMALCTPIPEKFMGFINEQCDITVCGELKHGKGNVAEEQTRKECMGHELVVLGDEYAGAGTIKAWADSGMKFMGVAKGTPATVDYRAIEEAGLELSYTPGRNRVAVAEFNIGLMICAARKICLAGTGLQKGEHLGQAVQDIYDVPDVKNVVWGPLDENHPFTDYGIGFELYGKKLGIAGYGAIGREVAVRARAFVWRYLPTILTCRLSASKQTAPGQWILRPCFLKVIWSVSICLYLSQPGELLTKTGFPG